MNVAFVQLPTDETHLKIHVALVSSFSHEGHHGQRQIIRLERHLCEPDVHKLDVVRTYSSPARRVRHMDGH